MKQIITTSLIGLITMQLTIAQNNESNKTQILNLMNKNIEEQSFREYEAIATALQSYIDAAKTGNGSGFKEDWFDHTRVVGSLDGESVNLDTDAFAKLIDDAGGDPNVESRIAWINYEGNAAAARIEFLNWGGARYTDFFILYKKDGKWLVSGKVYDSHSRN